MASAGLAFADLFDPPFLERVELLTLRASAVQKGGRLADQRTAARGQGSDFADFKPYVAGDDLRAIDWNIYRRVGKAFVRVFEERQDLPVYLLVDVSRSMFADDARIAAALRTALALAAAALGRHDTVSLMPFSDDLAIGIRNASGRAAVARVAHALADCAPAGRTALADAIGRLGAMRLRRGLVILVSDFFADDGLEPVLDALSRLPHRLLLTRIARASDADPSLDSAIVGEVLIDDGEADATVAVAITPDLIERYRAAYRRFDERLSGFARDRGIGLVSIDADRDVIDQLSPLLGAGSVPL